MAAHHISDDERTTLLGHSGPTTEASSVFLHSHANDSPRFHEKVYRRRWWILAVFSITASVQNVLWNTWPPIGDTMLIAYGWQPSFLALCLCMCSIGISLCTFPFMYIIETRGKARAFLHYSSYFNVSVLRMAFGYAYFSHIIWL